MAEVDVLDAGREPQLGTLGVALQAPVGPVPCLAVDQQPQPLLEGERLVLGALQLLGQGAGHPGKPKAWRWSRVGLMSMTVSSFIGSGRRHARTRDGGGSWLPAPVAAMAGGPDRGAGSTPRCGS